MHCFFSCSSFPKDKMSNCIFEDLYLFELSFSSCSFHSSTNLCSLIWLLLWLRHTFVLSSISTVPHFNIILQMLKTWNLSSTLTTQTTLRTIFIVLAEQLVAKRRGPLIPSSPITMWDRQATLSLCSVKPTRQSTPSSYKWWKTEVCPSQKLL